MESWPVWSLTALAVLLAVGWYLSYLAGRLDRLHHRVESSYAALDAQLARRAAAAVEVARFLPPDRASPVRAAATTAASEASTSPATASAGREDVENALTRALARALDDEQVTSVRAERLGAVALDDLAAATHRVQLARRFHNDAVAHAQRMRRKRVVRWARLAGRARWPEMVEIDDSRPAALSTETVP